MRKLFLIIALILLAWPVRAQTPALIRVLSGENSRLPYPGNTGTNATYYVHDIDPAIGGNCFGVYAMWNNSNSPTITVTEDKGDTLSLVKRVNGSTYSAALWITSSVTSGAFAVSIAYSTYTTYITPFVFEVANCGGVDSTAYSGQESIGTTVTPGSLTPTQSGDMLLQFAVTEATGAPAITGTPCVSAGSQSNITWGLRIAECLDGTILQGGIYSSTSSINPSLTIGSTNSWISIAVALKAASAGRVPTGIYSQTQEHVSMNQTNNGGPGYANPSVTQFPCSGNLLNVRANGGSPITSIAENGTNLGYVSFPDANGTYPQSYIGNGASEAQEDFRATNHACNNSHTFTITPNVNYTGNGYSYDFTLIFDDVVNGGNFDKSVDSHASDGNITSCSSPCNLTGPSLTPSNPNELIFNEGGEWYNVANGVSGSGVLDSLYVSINSLGSSSAPSVDENNMYAHYLDVAESAYSTTYTFSSTSLAQGYWADVAVAFSAAASSGSGVNGGMNGLIR